MSESMKVRPGLLVRAHDPMLEERPNTRQLTRPCRCEKPMVVAGDELGVRCYRCGRVPRTVPRAA